MNLPWYFFIPQSPLAYIGSLLVLSSIEWTYIHHYDIITQFHWAKTPLCSTNSSLLPTATIDFFFFTISNFFLSFLEVHMEKAMTPHSSTLAWKILWTEEPGRLQSVGSLRVGHDWATSLSHFTFMHWRRKWQPTPVFLPGESQGWWSLVGCRLWGRTESDTTEAT